MQQKKLLEVLISENGTGIFDPHNDKSHKPDIIADVMAAHNFTRLLSDVKKFWAFAAKKLSVEYAGDPRNIFSEIQCFEEIQNRCRYVPKTKAGFMGFQKKMTSMLTYFLRDRRLIELKNFPPPVDFHLMRVMVLTGILVLDDSDSKRFRYETSHLLGYKAIETYLGKAGSCPIELGDALWLLSSNLCSRSPKNKDHLGFGTFDKPTILAATKQKRKRLNAHPGLFDSLGVELPIKVPIGTKSMRETCERCPVHAWCRGGMPAVEYYTYGLLELRN